MRIFMDLPLELASVEGARELWHWFGYWPDFHDAEVLRLDLNRSGSSSLSVNTWHTTGEIDEDGYYRREKNVTVEFTLTGISDLDLNGFSHQNVVGNIKIEKSGEALL